MALFAVVSTTASAASPPPVRSGETYTVRRGATLILRLSNPAVAWSTPKVDGKAVTLRRVRFERDPGYGQWIIRAHRRGSATITARGVPSCARPPCALGPLYWFSVRVVVR